MRLSWDDYFMQVAQSIASRSEDPRTKVGAVLVKDGRIRSTGYNGAPAGVQIGDIWNTEDKHLYVVHAEANCLLYSNIEDRTGATLYCTHSPCRDCTKLIAAAGISLVIFSIYHKSSDLNLLQSFGVEVRQLIN